jgi:hypothetical protein
MIIRLTVFGIEVFCLSAGNFILEEESEEEEPEADCSIGGGPSQNFERDTNPLSPDDRYDWGEWDFGFGSPKRVRKRGGERAPD